MTYSRTQRPTDRVAMLVIVGGLHVAAFYAVIAGLSVVFVPADNPPPIRATNTPLPPPPPDPARPHPRAHPDQRPVRSIPASDPLPIPSPTIVDPVIREVQPAIGDPPGGEVRLPEPRPTVATRAPQPARPLGQPGRWVSEADYPTNEIRLGHAGVVGFRLTIAETGRVQGCEITRSSGFPVLDSLTCSLVARRARFEPARNDQGRPVTGRYDNAVLWQIPD